MKHRRIFHWLAAFLAACHMFGGPLLPGGVHGGPMALCKDGTVRPFQSCPK